MITFHTIWTHVIGIIGSTGMQGRLHGWGQGEQGCRGQDMTGLDHGGVKFDCCGFVVLCLPCLHMS